MRGVVADGADPEDKDEHQLFVPRRARWSEIQRTASNIGEAVNKACVALERDNASREGVLAGIDFNDARKLGDARNRDVACSRWSIHRWSSWSRRWSSWSRWRGGRPGGRRARGGYGPDARWRRARGRAVVVELVVVAVAV